MYVCIVPLKYIEYGVYGDLIIIYPKPYSMYLIKGDYVRVCMYVCTHVNISFCSPRRKHPQLPEGGFSDEIYSLNSILVINIITNAVSSY